MLVTLLLPVSLLTIVLHLYFKSSLSHSKVVNCVIELSCILIPLIFPLTFLWIPFMHYGYGLGGYDCWIKDMDHINCTTIYTDIIITIIYSVSEAISLEMLASSATVFIVYCRMRTSLRVNIHTLIQKTCYLVSFYTCSCFCSFYCYLWCVILSFTK